MATAPVYRIPQLQGKTTPRSRGTTTTAAVANIICKKTFKWEKISDVFFQHLDIYWCSKIDYQL